MNERLITLTATDGFRLGAFRATPAEPMGGLVVIQEIFGISDQIKSVVRNYAKQGFDTIAPAVYDRIEPGTVIPFDEIDRARQMMLQLRVDQVMLDVAAAIEAINTEKGVSVLGFCWGGGMAIRAAGIYDLRGAIAYYGTSLDKHIGRGSKCPTLFHFGENDSIVPDSVIETVKQTFPDAEIYTYDAGHAFANDARETYVPNAAELANERTLGFLNRMHRFN